MYLTIVSFTGREVLPPGSFHKNSRLLSPPPPGHGASSAHPTDALDIVLTALNRISAFILTCGISLQENCMADSNISEFN